MGDVPLLRFDSAILVVGELGSSPSRFVYFVVMVYKKLMKITKRPKKVKVTYEEIKVYRSNYTCPSCFVVHIGGGPEENVLRFKCSCGQVLIVEK